MINLKDEGYNPDVLCCLANLSNDEVFTPPEIANKMLDLLPQELFRDPTTTFLDPACKSGVFLREIARRLIVGLQPKIPDLQERLDHIFHKQLYGVAITQLTSLLSRRSLYCSKFPNSKYSVTRFDSPEGNIRFRRTLHTWKDGKCVYCGVAETMFGEKKRSDLESHAYEFIHLSDSKELFKMKFDVIISNPPYQMNVGVEKENYAIPIYDRFVEQAKKLNPSYLVMIIPARWYAGGRGLDKFRDSMLKQSNIVELHDFPNSTDCFPGVDIAGGICYFLWRSGAKETTCRIIQHYADKVGEATFRPLLEPGMNTFIRHNEAVSILAKTRQGDKTFESLVSAQTPFGFVSSFDDYKAKPFPGSIKYYTYGDEGYVSRKQVSRRHDLIGCHKIYLSAAYGERGPYPYQFLGRPFYGAPNTCCSQSYLVIGPFKTRQISENVMSYMRTRFFRFMIMLKKNAQHNMSYVFGCVPLQDFSKPWTDAELYKKYKLTPEEIAFIESMVRPME